MGTEPGTPGTTADRHLLRPCAAADPRGSPVPSTVLEQVKVFYRGERVVLVWDGLSAHWSRAMRAWVAEQDWLTLERLPAYAPELNPVELLWSSLKKRELANPQATTSPMSPNRASTGSTPTLNCPGPSSPTPDSPSTHQPHPTNEKISRQKRVPLRASPGCRRFVRSATSPRPGGT
ncbi:transposase [Streptomyces sp. NPDC000963]